jgi:hypothetical protein
MLGFTLFCAAAASLATNAAAATQLFSGSSYNINPPAAPGAPCAAPLLNLSFGPANTGGSSNFGAFTYTQAHCAVGGPGAYSGGVFEYFFDAGDTLSGTYSGVLAPSGIAGLLNNTINYVVTSGTGRFLNASGTIDGIGTLDFRSGPARADLVLNGTLALPAVPEPASWAMMVGGFGVMGGMMRRRVRAGAALVLKQSAKV